MRGRAPQRLVGMNCELLWTPCQGGWRNHMKAQDPPRQIHSYDWTIQCVFLSRCTGVLFFCLWFQPCLHVGFRIFDLLSSSLWASLLAQLVKKPTCNVGDPDSIPGLGRSSREGVGYPLQYSWASLVAQLVKNLPTMRETCVYSLAWGDSPGEGKGHPLQYSDLEYFPNCILHGLKESDMD